MDILLFTITEHYIKMLLVIGWAASTILKMGNLSYNGLNIFQ